MSEVSKNKYNELIKTGIGRNEFITKFKELFSAAKTENELSIFDTAQDDETISFLFDTITSAHDDNDIGDKIEISKADVSKIASYDNDKSSVSEEDIKMYYEDLISKYEDELERSNVSDEPEISPNENDVSKHRPQITSAKALDMLYALKEIKILGATAYKTRIQKEIDDLISKLDKQQKKEAEKINNQIKKKSAEIAQKTAELANKQNNINIYNSQLKKKQGALGTTQDFAEQKRLAGECRSFESKINVENDLLTGLEKDIKNLKKEQADLRQKLTSLVGQTKESDELNIKYAELDQIDRILNSDISDIDSQIIQYQGQIEPTAHKAGRESAYYYDIAAGHVSNKGVTADAASALSKAVGEIGTREATGHNDGAAVAKYRGGVDNGAHWCASFVSWCYKGKLPYHAAVTDIRSDAIKNESYVAVRKDQKDLRAGEQTYVNSHYDSSFRPKPGDIMIQKSNGASHTGIVKSVDEDGTIHTVEGNASNMVRSKEYRPGTKEYNKISGYVRMS